MTFDILNVELTLSIHLFVSNIQNKFSSSTLYFGFNLTFSTDAETDHSRCVLSDIITLRLNRPWVLHFSLNSRIRVTSVWCIFKRFNRFKCFHDDSAVDRRVWSGKCSVTLSRSKLSFPHRALSAFDASDAGGVSAQKSAMRSLTHVYRENSQNIILIASKCRVHWTTARTRFWQRRPKFNFYSYRTYQLRGWSQN